MDIIDDIDDLDEAEEEKNPFWGLNKQDGEFWWTGTKPNKKWFDDEPHADEDETFDGLVFEPDESIVDSLRRISDTIAEIMAEISDKVAGSLSEKARRAVFKRLGGAKRVLNKRARLIDRNGKRKRKAKRKERRLARKKLTEE